MPKKIEEQLTKMVRDFVWGEGTTPTIGLSTLHLCHERGGKKILNIKLRNEAIELMKVKRYLKLDHSRPTWAIVADRLIGLNIAKKWKASDSTSFQNTFLQYLDVDARSKEDGIPPSLRRMFKTAGKYGVCFQPLMLSQNLQGKMPFWFHLEMKNTKYLQLNSPTAHCLKVNHKVATVDDAEELERKTDPTINTQHKGRQNCACVSCRAERQRGCENPNKCGIFTRDMLNKLGLQWNPKRPEMPRHITERDREIDGRERSLIFNPEIMIKENLGEGFRLFTKEQEYSRTDNEDYTRRTLNNPTRVVVYTDGSCQKNRSVEAVAGAGAWFRPGDHRNLALRLPPTIEHSNNAEEAYAVLAAIQKVPWDASLHIISDSQLVIDSLTKNLKEREDNGWIGSTNKELMKCLVALKEEERYCNSRESKRSLRCRRK
ncbi:Ribonuclease H1 [Termitomyces sp. J132]|nr:Ribonuclease H1 [Termitomyces sp. J132]